MCVGQGSVQNVDSAHPGHAEVSVSALGGALRFKQHTIDDSECVYQLELP